MSTQAERAAFKRQEAEAIRPAFMGPPADAEHCPMCGQPVELRAAVQEFLRRWDDPERYHRLPAVDDLRAAAGDDKP